MVIKFYKKKDLTNKTSIYNQLSIKEFELNFLKKTISWVNKPQIFKNQFIEYTLGEYV